MRAGTWSVQCSEQVPMLNARDTLLALALMASADERRRRIRMEQDWEMCVWRAEWQSWRGGGWGAWGLEKQPASHVQLAEDSTILSSQLKVGNGQRN